MVGLGRRMGRVHPPVVWRATRYPSSKGYFVFLIFRLPAIAGPHADGQATAGVFVIIFLSLFLDFGIHLDFGF